VRPLASVQVTERCYSKNPKSAFVVSLREHHSVRIFTVKRSISIHISPRDYQNEIQEYVAELL
jgi:hypothetical protein